MARRDPVITIDGPAGAGKSTVARALAARLGFTLIDTGAMYRALAWSVREQRLAAEDSAPLRRHVESVRIELEGERVLVDGRDVTGEIRSPEISELTSTLTALALVRAKVTPLQRRLAAAGGVVLEGRDTGTIVCPDAMVKFYLDADLDERARRRQTELAARGVRLDVDAVRGEIRVRDAQDTSRVLAPLTPAPDAIRVDTTGKSVEAVVALMLRHIEERCCTRS